MVSNLNISNAQASNRTNIVKDVTIDPLVVNSPQDQEETTSQNHNFETQWAKFNRIPKLKSSIIMAATWEMGKGYIADIRTGIILDGISGRGKESFLDIIKNMCVIKRVGGDSFAEIIGDEQNPLINLIVRNPVNIKKYYNRQGRITKYEDTTTGKTWPPEKMLHF